MNSIAAHNIAEEALLPEVTLRVPLWFSDYVASLISGRRSEVKFTRTERRALRRKERIPVSEWAEENGFVPMGAHDEKWRNEVSPHAARIMDTWGRPWVREVVYCTVEQDGKTAIEYICLGYAMDIDPGPAMAILPTEKKAGDTNQDRIIPMFKGSKALKKLVSDRADDTAKLRLSLKNGGKLYMAWANSADALASWPIKYSFFDETDKYPERTGKETDPITLGERRNRTYRYSYKRFKGSTPTRDIGYIYRELQGCPQIQQWQVKCTGCHEYFQAAEEHIVIPEGATIESIMRKEHAIHMACPHCGSLHDEQRRVDACKAGRWLIIKGEDLARPEKVGFHRQAYCCPDVPMTEIAMAKIKRDEGDLAAKIAYANGVDAVNYEDNIEGANDAQMILRHKSELPRNAVPLGSAMIGMVADTQHDHFYYQVWAFGFAPEITMHMVRHGIVQKFSDLTYILHEEEFEDADLQSFKIQCGLIDSGGTRKRYEKHSRTVQVYDWCASEIKMTPIKGIWSRRDGSMISYKPVETYPGTNKRIPGGLIRVDAKVDYFKDELARRLAIEPGDPGAMTFHDSIDEGFAKHYCSEGKNEKGEWEHDTKKGRNDYWDCNVYGMVLREILKTRIPRMPGPTQSKQKKSKPKNDKSKSRRW